MKKITQSCLITAVVCVTSALAITPSSFAEETTSNTAQSENKPLWELGFGAGVLQAPVYPSSSENQFRGLALPYVVYRGDVFRIGDGQTARAVAFENDTVELDLSFAAAFNSYSEDNDLRAGMDDLDYLFQLGPQMKVKLGNYSFADHSTSSLTLALQARGVFSTDLGSINHRGYVFEPMLQYKHLGFLSPKLDATISLKPQWATEQLHEYFFDVEQKFVNANRARYRSDEGYFGTGLNLYANYRVNERYNVFFSIQTMSHHGSSNHDSPLYEKDFTIGFGAGFVAKLFASKKTVQVSND